MNCFVPVILATLWGLFPAQTADNLEGSLTGLEKKLCDDWRGTVPCQGDVLFHADKTYERKHAGPGGTNSTGVWKVRWDALPPTLDLTCRTSDDATDVGKRQEWKITELNDASLRLKYGEQGESPFERREKK